MISRDYRVILAHLVGIVNSFVKFFAIYPNVCYNVTGSAYQAKRLGGVGFNRLYQKIKERIGFVLGALFFLASVTYADKFIFSVDFVGASVYKREALMALEQGGIKNFSPYREKNTDWICSQILALDGVEYCSVKKRGFKAVVEIRLSPFALGEYKKGDMVSAREGELLSLTALSGTPLKKTGDKVGVGDILVGGWFEKDEGQKVPMKAIARASIACIFEDRIEAETKEQAFAIAYLKIGLREKDSITQQEIVQEEKTFHVKISYVAVEQINM